MNVIKTHTQPGGLVGNADRYQSQAKAAQPSQSDNAKAQDALLNKLADNIPGMQGSDLRKLDAEDFTPDKVAGRIAGFVSMGLANARADGRSEEDIAKLHQQAMKGIEKGFKDAQKILDDMGLLKGEIKSNIDTTYDLTMDAVKALQPGQPPGLALPSASFYASERYAQAESFSLSLTTQEGDQISIEFGNSSYYNASAGFSRNEDGSTAGFSIERGVASNLSFSINGDLNDEEMAAIESLLKDVNEIADDFFSGDVQQAFEKASEYRMDGSQLASMNLRLEQSQSYSAAAAYSRVGSLPAVDNGNALAPLQGLAGKLNGAVNDPKIAFMDQADQFVSELLDNLALQDSRYKDADADQQNKLDSNLQLLNDMMDSMFA
ncbi:DUF5610 domain-containing protein [Marinobacterium arenosum]|uniref:DUF5610 domain-containing protein n=1 Tax=Marinobacterium arenosum TaxID=2862496 RepID=UPI001C943C2C|nr:DUF5610 domain-containing protein [Marinobacterium arenosum]MBY4678511.1 DUF5610 domain-containing protein [Marinobacterium arenosum]